MHRRSVLSVPSRSVAHSLAARRPRRNAADRILRAAALRLSTLGAAELSLQDVAATAGVSKALIHYHYKDKESLLEQVALWATAESVDRERQALDNSTAATAVDALWRWLEGELRDGHLRLLVELGQYRAPRVRAAVDDALRVRRDASMHTIRRLFELLELRPRVPVELLAGVVVAFIDGLASRPASGTPDDARVTFDIFWLSLLSLAE
jgi:AcrR family transcriptional regulator